MRKLFAVAILISFCLSVLSACANNSEDRILIYPEYVSEENSVSETGNSIADSSGSTQIETETKTEFESDYESYSEEINTEIPTEVELTTEISTDESETASKHVDIDENFYCDVCGTRLEPTGTEDETNLIQENKVLFDKFYDSSFDLSKTEHSNGSKMTDESDAFQSGDTILQFLNYTNLYKNARDAMGNPALKLGKSDALGSFEITIPENVSIVVLKIAKYKDHDSTVIINGREYTLIKESNNGEYDEIIIDTANVKRITVSTTKSHTMCMIRSIEFIK